MKNSISEVKTDLISWISNLDDLEVLSELMDFKKKKFHASRFEETHAEEDKSFDEQFAAAMTPEELLENVLSHIETLPERE